MSSPFFFFSELFLSRTSEKYIDNGVRDQVENYNSKHSSHCFYQKKKKTLNIHQSTESSQNANILNLFDPSCLKLTFLHDITTNMYYIPFSGENLVSISVVFPF